MAMKLSRKQFLQVLASLPLVGPPLRKHSSGHSRRPASSSSSKPGAYFAPGYHGGYFLTPDGIFQPVLDKLFDLLETDPRFKVTFEVEPYTLQRMKGGEKFGFEKFGRTGPAPRHWGLAGAMDYAVGLSEEAARSGRYGIRMVFNNGYYAQALASVSAEKLRGRDLVFSGWIRQRKGTGAHLSIVNGPGSPARTGAVPADGEWHRVELKWKVPHNAVRFFPQAKCDRETTDADFDDLALEDSETGEELLANGGFEELAQPTLRDEGRLQRLREFIRLGRIEIVGGAYTQPILYATGDESSLRQFHYGARAVEEAIGVPVRIYAAQEPGMCSQLPQILTQAGFEGVLYRTMWGIFGSAPHRNAEKVWWVGNDGSRIPTVPAYELFPLLSYALRARPEAKLIERLKKVGIVRPLFATLEDFLTERMPEARSAAVTGGLHGAISVATLGEYFGMTGQPKEEWRDAFHAFEFRFPFGLLAGEVQRVDRDTENMLLQTERLLAIAGTDGSEMLHEAWEAHLIGGHHDAWVCAPIFFGICKQRTYAEMCKAAYREAQGICHGLIKDIGCLRPLEGTEFSLVNTSGFARSETVSVKLTLPRGAARRPAVSTWPFSQRSNVPGRIRVVSKHPDGSAKEVEAVLLARVPATGYRRYLVGEGKGLSLPKVNIKEDRPPRLDNGLIRLTASRQGVLIARRGQKPLAVWLAGNFPGKGEVKTAVAATGAKLEGGGGAMSGDGEIGGVPFQGVFRLEPNSPLVRMSLEFDFGDKTDVGAQEDLDQKRLPSHARDEQKLRVVIPLPFGVSKFFSHAPFEVRQVDRERYPILRYAMAEGKDGHGIAVLTDRAMGGVFRKEPGSLEVVLAYGGRFLYAPHHYAPLVGKHRFEFGLLPYEGGWQRAEIPRWSEVFSQPLLVGRARDLPEAESLITMEPEGAVLITALMRQGKHLLVRVWRPYEGEAEVKVRITGATRLRRTDLLHRSHQPESERIRIRQHGIVTLCAEVA